MALRSVVLESPAAPGAPRRTVVLRPGGPKPKGGFVDIATGLLGVLLLVAAVVLVQVLPDTDYVNPRYKVSYPAGGGEAKTPPAFDFVESGENIHEFPFDIQQDNIVSINVRASFTDDLEASLPDLFRIRLIDPLGNEVGQPENFQNDPPVQGNGTTSATFTAVPAIMTWTFPVGPLPQEAIVQGATHKETQKEALDRLEPVTHAKTAGTWIVKVELLQAGDCPEPGPDTNQAQVAACVQSQFDPNAIGPPSTADTGNRFTVENVAWTYYLTCTETMELRNPKPLPSCK